MRLFFLLLAATAALRADWKEVQRIPLDRKIEITIRNGPSASAKFVSANDEAIAVRDKSGERSIARSDIREVRVADSSRRLRNGLIWIAVGAAAGGAIGAAACLYCANEGHGYKFVGPGIALGAGIGALGLLVPPYRTIYKNK